MAFSTAFFTAFFTQPPPELSNLVILTVFFTTVYYALLALSALGSDLVKNTLWVWQTVGSACIVSAMLIAQPFQAYVLALGVLWALPVALEYVLTGETRRVFERMFMRVSYRARLRFARPHYGESALTITIVMFVEMATNFLLLLVLPIKNNFRWVQWALTLCLLLALVIFCYYLIWSDLALVIWEIFKNVAGGLMLMLVVLGLLGGILMVIWGIEPRLLQVPMAH